MYRQHPFSEQKQQKAKVNVKETDPTCSQIWLFPAILTYTLNVYVYIYIIHMHIHTLNVYVYIYINIYIIHIH